MGGEQKPGQREPHGARPPNWLSFSAQALLVSLAELGDDIVQGNIVPPAAAQALQHARQVIAFEMAHGFFLEPRLQTAVLRSYHLLFLEIPSTVTVSVLNGIYAFCHIFVTLLVGAWVFRSHPTRFALLRNVILLTTLLALAGYELYPLAPPRLSSGLVVDGHAILFHDTVRHFLGTGRLSVGSIGYNPYSAMPSLHVAWALIIGAAVVVLARHPLVRFLGLLYPAVVAFDVVITGNHYLLDVVGAAVTVSIATVLALLIEWLQRLQRATRQGGGGPPCRPGRTSRHDLIPM